MGLTVQDILPKPFTVTIKGVDLECKPLRLSHALIVGKLADVFNNPKEYTAKDIKLAEADIDDVIGEIMPELKGAQLGMTEIASIVTQLMSSVRADDDIELNEAGVRFENDPKAQTPQTGAIG